MANLFSHNNIRVSITSGTILRLILFGLLIALLIALGELVLVILTAVVIASFVESGVHRFREFRIPRAVAVIIIYIATIVGLALLFYFLVPTFLVELTSLVNLISGYLPESSLIEILEGSSLGEAQEIIRLVSDDGLTVNELIENAGGILSSISAGFVQTISTIFGGVVNLILIFIISFYLSMQRNGIEHFLRIITPLQHEAYVIDLWHRTRRKISFWVQGQFILGVIVGALTYVGLTLIGIEYALFLAIATALLELIPYGIFLAVIPAISFAFAAGGLTPALLVGGLYIIIQQLENYVIAPLVVNRVVGISPLVVILAIVIGVKLAGFWGLILAIPAAVAILEFINDVEQKKVLAGTEETSADTSSV